MVQPFCQQDRMGRGVPCCPMVDALDMRASAVLHHAELGKGPSKPCDRGHPSMACLGALHICSAQHLLCQNVPPTIFPLPPTWCVSRITSPSYIPSYLDPTWCVLCFTHKGCRSALLRAGCFGLRARGAGADVQLLLRPDQYRCHRHVFRAPVGKGDGSCAEGDRVVPPRFFKY